MAGGKVTAGNKKFWPYCMVIECFMIAMIILAYRL